MHNVASYKSIGVWFTLTYRVKPDNMMQKGLCVQLWFIRVGEQEAIGEPIGRSDV